MLQWNWENAGNHVSVFRERDWKRARNSPSYSLDFRRSRPWDKDLLKEFIWDVQGTGLWHWWSVIQGTEKVWQSQQSCGWVEHPLVGRGTKPTLQGYPPKWGEPRTLSNNAGGTLVENGRACGSGRICFLVHPASHRCRGQNLKAFRDWDADLGNREWGRMPQEASKWHRWSTDRQDLPYKSKDNV